MSNFIFVYGILKLMSNERQKLFFGSIRIFINKMHKMRGLSSLLAAKLHIVWIRAPQICMSEEKNNFVAKLFIFFSGVAIFRIFIVKHGRHVLFGRQLTNMCSASNYFDLEYTIHCCFSGNNRRFGIFHRRLSYSFSLWQRSKRI